MLYDPPYEDLGAEALDEDKEYFVATCEVCGCALCPICGRCPIE